LLQAKIQVHPIIIAWFCETNNKNFYASFRIVSLCLFSAISLQAFHFKTTTFATSGRLSPPPLSKGAYYQSWIYSHSHFQYFRWCCGAGPFLCGTVYSLSKIAAPARTILPIYLRKIQRFSFFIKAFVKVNGNEIVIFKVNFKFPQHGTAWHCMAQHVTTWHSMAQHGIAWHSMALHGIAWHSMA
jgi:hypothetical protein